MSILRAAFLLPVLLLLMSCGDKRTPAGSQEELEEHEEDAGIWKSGGRKWILLASIRSTDPDGDGRVTFVEGKLEKAGIVYATNGTLGVQGISVPLEDKERALKALSSYLDENGFILPRK